MSQIIMGLIADKIFKNQYGYTFNDLLEGYDRSLRLIKKIDRPAFNKIIKIIVYYQTEHSDKFDKFLEALKDHFLDDENFDKAINLTTARLVNGGKVTKVNLFTQHKLGLIEASVWDMLDISQITVFPFEIAEKEATYTIAPIFQDYKNISSGINEGIPFYTKNVEREIMQNFSTEKEYEYVLYKDENGSFKVQRVDLNDKKVTKNLNIEL